MLKTCHYTSDPAKSLWQTQAWSLMVYKVHIYPAKLLIHLLDESTASLFYKHIDQIPTSKPSKLSQASYSENITWLFIQFNAQGLD